MREEVGEVGQEVREVRQMSSHIPMESANNKSIHGQKTRTTLVDVGIKKLGYLERIILSYIVTRKTWTFSISDISVHLRRIGQPIDRRRLWDAVQRLSRRGFIEKVKRGIYKLVKDIDLSLIKNKGHGEKEERENKDNLCRFVSGGCVGGGGSGGGGRRLVRVHAVVGGGGFVDLLLRVELAYRFLVVVRRVLIGYGVGVLGLSRSGVRRLLRGVGRAVDGALVGAEGVVGCHGRYGRRFYGLSSLVPLRECDDGHYYECGVDVLLGNVDELVSSIPKFFVKIYSTSA